ncbi:aminopeptidase O isoform X1 [Symphalangus syndactylus]|uniref:aminopeptidase O isoform X1 n=1 Tax=Symphalangus syndactylus TaxID=9590 RepID=UPI0024416FAB|nr:aminopeptidase O isoform X1 [Symphalangus syndactylus]XP_055127808.1 aminopeptidase O isoform X1 [Symphalangus syndactylus]XP_055127809.1 aminopeptidase O isoform X1 [Symphalangus syndactylus]
MDIQLDPARDDLPLMANTSHILVKHYVLDLDVDFESQVIEGTIVLFLEDGKRFKKQNSSVEEACQSESNKACKFGMPEPCHIPVTNARTFSSEMEYNDFAICSKGEKDTSDKDGNHDNQEHASGISSSKYCCDTGNHGSEDFLLVLDCCDLSVLKVEEVDVAAVPGLEKFTRSPELTVVSEEFRNQIVHELVTLPANRWREQLDYYACCSQAPGCGELLFDTDTWSLQIRKTGAQTATDFPHAIRIWYKTKPEGRSVTWTSDQSGRPCVYTVGSPINNRALFPCQEPPVAMSTWQATVRAAASFVLMSGENSAKPTQLWEGCSSWYYYVTMPMPASTFTIAVGYWTEMKMETCSSNDLATERPFSPSEADFRHVGVCSHMEYPCRFQNASATTQEIIPHRVFAPVCLTGACQETLLRLIPPCLSAAHSILGTHPFSRLDVLIVPANFPSLGMASPHIVFLSQSILTGGSHLCGTRLCHEIAHAWFGLAIGARDWTEEWLSEGFATHLEDVFWAAAQQLDPHEAREQQELRACLRWRRLQDEMQCSPEEMQVLRPSKDKTGHTSDSGASVIKHGLNPEKIFMQVHYLKGYFLLRFLTKRLGDETYFSFLRKFVHTFHGQLILSQDFLQMLLENIPEEKRLELSVENIYQDWLESSGIPKPLQRERRAGAECRLARQVRAEVTKWIRVNRRPRKRKRREKEDVFEKLLPDQLVLLLEHLLEQKTLSPRTLQSLQRTYHLQDQDAEVRHRWCELIVKHKFTKAYKSVERFLQEDQERPQRDSFIRLLLAWGTRLELTLDIKGGIMWLLKPSAHSPVHVLVLLFPRGWSQPGTHKRQILVNAASLPGGCLLPWIWSGAALGF